MVDKIALGTGGHGFDFHVNSDTASTTPHHGCHVSLELRCLGARLSLGKNEDLILKLLSCANFNFIASINLLFTCISL